MHASQHPNKGWQGLDFATAELYVIGFGLGCVAKLTKEPEDPERSHFRPSPSVCMHVWCMCTTIIALINHYLGTQSHGAGWWTARRKELSRAPVARGCGGQLVKTQAGHERPLLTLSLTLAAAVLCLS
jgi:hypothetical protein